MPAPLRVLLVAGLAAAATALAAAPGAAPGPAGTDAVEAIAPGARAALAELRPEALSAHIRFLADDLLQGRVTGSEGHAIAARYVASQLQALGAEPAGEHGTYFQQVRLRGARVRSASLEVLGGRAGAPFVADRDFFADAELTSGRADVEAPLVFVGHGMAVPEYGYDGFRGVDVRGKIAVLLGGAPRSDRRDFFPSLPSAVYGEGERVLAGLRRRGAVGAIVVWTPVLESTGPFEFMVQNAAFESMALADDPPAIPSVTISGPAFDRLLRQAGRKETLLSLVAESRAGRPRAFALGVRARIRVDSPVRTLTSQNVLGVLRGDPRSPRAKELVALGAHLDHMGVGPAVAGDSVYNGASDDAAGVGSVLEIVRALSSLPRRPARSVLVLVVTGEEEGLLGSRWLAAHPTVPLADVVADVDVDMAYPIHPLKDVVAIGTDETTLAADVRRAADALGLGVSPDPDPDQAYFVRSDNWSLVKQGIPAAQTGWGVAGLDPARKAAEDAFWKARYHQPQDGWEPDRDWTPLADLARFEALLTLSIAERPERPAWNPDSWFRRFPEPASP